MVHRGPKYASLVCSSGQWRLISVDFAGSMDGSTRPSGFVLRTWPWSLEAKGDVKSSKATAGKVGLQKGSRRVCGKGGLTTVGRIMEVHWYGPDGTDNQSECQTGRFSLHGLHSFRDCSIDSFTK